MTYNVCLKYTRITRRTFLTYGKRTKMASYSLKSYCAVSPSITILKLGQQMKIWKINEFFKCRLYISYLLINVQ